MKILKAIINDFKKRVCNERGIAIADDVAIALGIGALSGGAGWLGSMLGSGKQSETAFQAPTWYQTPDYPETTEARETWWSNLQKWGSEPGYGAIAPNWEDIWKQAQKRVSEYWRGSATTPGVMDRIKASVARRGVEESPAYATLATRAGAEEAGQLQDIATTMATQEAQFAETGRQNWLQSLMSLSGLKPSGVWSTGQGYMTTPTTSMGDVIGDVGSGLFDLAANYYQQSWLENLMSKYKFPSTTQESLT